MVHNKNHEKLEAHFVEEEEKRLEEMVKLMKLHGRTQEQICNFLSRRASHYMRFMDRYCNDKRYNECKGGCEDLYKSKRE